MRYPGGKGKCFQRIINVLPPHSVYIETHLGGGSVLRNKTPALRSIGIDRDPRVIRLWRQNFPDLANFIEADALDVLMSLSFQGDELVYCDPPYLPKTRRRDKVYRFDYSEADHISLLSRLRTLPCFVVLSGYGSDLYNNLLAGWNALQFDAKTHIDLRREWLWFNFDIPGRLHDPSHLGSNFRERQTVKRRSRRLQDRISQLTTAEKFVLSDWLLQHLEEETRGEYGNLLLSKR
jgi:DNA adenine methylase